MVIATSINSVASVTSKPFKIFSVDLYGYYDLFIVVSDLTFN
jgi:hypothetical protein